MHVYALILVKLCSWFINRNTIPEGPPSLEAHGSILRLNTAWSPEQLDAMLYQEMQKWPQHEIYLSAEVRARKVLFGRIAKKEKASIEQVSNAIRMQVAKACCPIEIQGVKSQFMWILSQVPELEYLFDGDKTL